MIARVLAVLGLLAFAAQTADAAGSHTVHGLSLFGDLAYPADFKNFKYVNPDAPKGGELRLSMTGGFDNFNPFIAKGRAPGGLDR